MIDEDIGSWEGGLADPRLGRYLCVRLTGLVLTLLIQASPAAAETYRAHSTATLTELVSRANPGDIVELAAGTYEGPLYFGRPGLDGMPIVIRGVIGGDGQRPVVRGATNTVTIGANHVVFESIEVTGGAQRCVYVVGHDVTLRDVVVHDCPGQGIQSADADTGTLVIDRSEVYRCGGGEYDHQIYVTSDQATYPGSVFRLQHSYLHDATGGHSVKSRAERNEIYFNWIEGARYHELELIGPDVPNPPDFREDSDVVGNVLRKTNGESHGVRLGGDATSDTDGRYRLVHNVFWMKNATMSPVRLFDGVESLELYNNVFYVEGGGPTTLLRTARVRWKRGQPLIVGSHNYIPPGSTEVPSALVETIDAPDPGFVNLAGFDLRPAPGSPLIDAATIEMPTHPDAPFPAGLEVPSHHPQRALTRVVARRPVAGARPDVGAYEMGTPAPGDDGSLHLPRGASVPPPLAPTGRCSCDHVGRGSTPPAGLWVALALLGMLRRRRGPGGMVPQN